MEYFDIVDEQGNPTGETVERKTAHAKGIRHRTAHIWVMRQTENGVDILLQKRAQNKDSFPGCLDTSSAGHIQAGDEPLESAIRELGEELGIQARPEDLTFMGNFYPDYQIEFYGDLFWDREVVFVYAYTNPVDVKDLVLQEEELDGADWYDLEETIEACLKDDDAYCVPIKSLYMVREFADKRGWIQ